MAKLNKKIKIAIVASKFNDYITKRLLKACLDELEKQGVARKNVTTVWVPGAFEIPVAALALAKKKDIQAVITLGAVIKGETYHFDLVAQGTAQGIMQASMITGKPIMFGVLATNRVDQAYKRSEEQGHNKGREAAVAALEMINLLSLMK